MKIAILGAGKVGTTLGQRFEIAGHQVVYGARRPSDPKYAYLGTSVTTVKAAADQGDIVLLTTPWTGVPSALEAAGDFGGKVLIDATNPIGAGFTLTHGHGDSGAEQVSRWAKNARVVKAFNTTGVENMANPAFTSGAASMFVCGDDLGAVDTVVSLSRDIGFETMAFGKLENARLLEPFAMVWIKLSMLPEPGRAFAFGLLKR